MRLYAASICPVCVRPVSKGEPALLIARVRVLSKPRVYHGLSQNSFQHSSAIVNTHTRTTFVPRYLVHEACLPLPLPNKESMYELQDSSKDPPKRKRKPNV